MIKDAVEIRDTARLTLTLLSETSSLRRQDLTNDLAAEEGKEDDEMEEEGAVRS